MNRESEWQRLGLRQFQPVTCRVVEHRGRFGVDVEIIEPVAGIPAFIDFVLLREPGEHVTPADFPPVEAVLSAVTIDIMPWGELRLSARAHKDEPPTTSAPRDS